MEGREQGQEREEGDGRKGIGNKKHKWQVQSRQEEVKNRMGNGEPKNIYV